MEFIWREGLPGPTRKNQDVAEAAGCIDWVQNQLKRAYFWKYSLNDVMNRGFFTLLSQYYGGGGFCRVIAPLIMLALDQSRQTRLVYATDAGFPSTGERVAHMWVEFRYGELWYVLDYTWFKTGLQPFLRHEYYTITQPTPHRILYLECGQFWRSPITNVLSKCIHKRETSCLFVELMHIYSPKESEYRISELGELLDARMWQPLGGHSLYQSGLEGHKTILVCQAIVDDIMKTDQVSENTSNVVRFILDTYEQCT